MRVTVYGGTNNKYYTEKEIGECEKLGNWLAENKIELLTGACKGMPYFIGRAATKSGGRVIGYTPAINEKEHIEKYDFPMDGVSEMVYNKKQYSTMAENFLIRSWEMTPFSDVVIALGGSWGTYSELMFSFFAKKTIIVVEGFEGAGKAFLNTHKFFDERDYNPDVHLGMKIYKVKDISGAIEKIKQLK